MRPPLHWAARNNSLSLVRVILARDVLVDHADSDGETPLAEAARSNPDPAVLTALINAGADVNHRLPTEGQTPLHLATHNDNHQVIATLLAHGADIEAKDNDGARPFHYAAAYATPEHIELLDQSFARTDRIDNAGWSALHYAAANNPVPAVVHALITLGFSPNVTDDDNETPLHVAVQFAERRMGAAAAETIILALVGAGADVNARTIEIRRDHEAVDGVWLRLEDWTPLMYAAAYVEDVDLVRALLDSGADVDFSSVGEYRTPSHGNSGRGFNACDVLSGIRERDLGNRDAVASLLCGE